MSFKPIILFLLLCSSLLSQFLPFCYNFFLFFAPSPLFFLLPCLSLAYFYYLFPIDNSVFCLFFISFNLKTTLATYVKFILPTLHGVSEDALFLSEVQKLARTTLACVNRFTVLTLAGHTNTASYSQPFHVKNFHVKTCHSHTNFCGDSFAELLPRPHLPFLYPCISKETSKHLKCESKSSTLVETILPNPICFGTACDRVICNSLLLILDPFSNGIFKDQCMVFSQYSVEYVAVFLAVVAATSVALYYCVFQFETRSLAKGRRSLGWCCVCHPKEIENEKKEEEEEKVGGEEGEEKEDSKKPHHLVVLVNGIGGSPANWKYMEDQINARKNEKFKVYGGGSVSSCNSFMKTLDGLDVMGTRLAEEVLSVVHDTEGLKKISFVGHSMGGLIARYAIGQLYLPPDRGLEELEKPSTRGMYKKVVTERLLSMLGMKGDGRDDLGMMDSEFTETDKMNAEEMRVLKDLTSPFPEALTSVAREHQSHNSRELKGVEAEKQKDSVANQNGFTSHEGKSKEEALSSDSEHRFQLPEEEKGEEMTDGKGGGKEGEVSSTQESVMVAQGTGEGTLESEVGGTIAGLEPINFVTIATPHLGCLGRGHLPFLFKIGVLEKASPQLAPVIAGRTGKHLFIADRPNPLLLRMASDCEEGAFISSLKAFKKRIAYANTGWDQMVGWRTASIRRATEMPVLPKDEVDPRYRHVMRVEEPWSSEQPRSVSDIEDKGSGSHQKETEDIPPLTKIEDAIVTALQQMPWKRIDVSFHTAKWPWMAHNLIQVKSSWIHSDGESVIRHVIDNLDE